LPNQEQKYVEKT